MTGTIRHGSVTAVMGPSGAGKSTFVTTLCGKAYYGDVTGSIIINGVAEPFSKSVVWCTYSNRVRRMLCVFAFNGRDGWFV